jgi:hypothetical protein
MWREFFGLKYKRSLKATLRAIQKSFQKIILSFLIEEV